MTRALTIGEVAERTDLSVHALRFYEREGLLVDEVRRSANGRRLYSEDDVAWLTTCTWLRSSGMPLAEIRRYTDLIREGRGNEPERLALLRAHRERIQEQRAALDRCMSMITHKLAVYEDHLNGVDNGCIVRDAEEFEAG
ncbi:MerR family transcriptional regulator [Phytomonospora sp. NPDC050363]|uniref:MerR family transcriptional regulator n=1 Tax=Phytomonospora sp. NPDC050363 TaxID=3155642 RepID=UPI0033C0A661